MFTNITSKWKQTTSTKQKKFSTIGIRRPPTPPSPASFESPQIVEINEKGPYGATVPDARSTSSSYEPTTSSITSPQLELDFDPRTDDSISEWLPPNILSGSSEPITPPKRNVSLPNGDRAHPEAPAASISRARSEDTIREEPEQREVRSAPTYPAIPPTNLDLPRSRTACSWTHLCTTAAAQRTGWIT